MARESIPRRGAAAVVAVAVAALLGWVLHLAQAPPEGPVPVAWDRIACARCRMLVGDPAFAAQLHAREGILHFDDPGCLLLHVHESRPEIRAIYFHHHEEDRWISRERVGFARVGASPMGYELGARERSGAAPLSYVEALEHVLAREANRTQG